MAENESPDEANGGQHFEQEDDESYEDASEDVKVCSEMDLHTSIVECTASLNLFLNNRFSEARSRMEPWADRSMYHAMGYGTLMYLQAALTFEMTDIEAAVKAVKQAVNLCDSLRKKKSIMSPSGSRNNYKDYTEINVHAELCYAECLIERALLTFIQDENLISFVKGSLKIRACYQSYKETLKILEHRQWDDKVSKLHFESGVHLGIGIFNLMLSLLPSKILKLLEFVGFSGNKARGLRELEIGASQPRALRGTLCTLALLSYHTVMTYVLGTADGDIPLAEKLLKPCLEQYPKAAMFLFFAGRIEEIKGNLQEAVYKLEESVEAQSEWKQFHHLCYWELMWCHSFLGDWLLAMKYAERLCRESRWSQATYTFQKAAFLMMCDDQTDDSLAHIDYLMGEVPRLKQRIAGKSIPIEKFAVKKAKRYVDQGNRLVLPALELIYVWNGFMIIGKQPRLLEPILDTVEKTLNQVVQNKDQYSNYYDDYCLCLLLKGVSLKHRGQHMQAEQCFTEIQQLERKLKQDNYLVPYSMMELAVLYIQMGKLEEAQKMLHKAKHNHKGYSLESRLHFRIHAANLQLQAITADGSDQSFMATSKSAGSMNELEDNLSAEVEQLTL